MALSYRKHLKENFLLAYPVMLSQLGHVVVQVADTAMIGLMLGAIPLAAASIANYGIVSILLTFGVGVSYAITPLVAKADGESDQDTIIKTLRNGFLINLLTGIFLVLLILGVVIPFSHLLNQPEEVITLALPYLRIVVFSLIPLMIFQTFRQFAEGLSKTRVAMVIVLGSNGLNILLNYLFMKGALGMEPMGINGAGWATFISRALMAITMAWYVFRGRRFQNFRKGFSIGNYSIIHIKKLLHIGIPSGLQYIFEVGAFSFSLIMMGWISAHALAAHQIAVNLASISYMTVSGLAAAATIRVGNLYGQRDINGLRTAAYTMLLMALALMGVCALAFMFGKNFFPSLYINDETVIAMAAPLLVIAGFFQLSDGVQVVCIGALRGLQDVKIPSLFIFMAYWIIGLPIGYWLAFTRGLGPSGVWYGLLIGLTLTAIPMFLRFRMVSRKLLSDNGTNAG